MENLEYLQLNMNYYPAAEGLTDLIDEEGSSVWKGLENYLDMLKTQGWVMIKESKADRDQSRTYYLKRPVE